MKTALYVVICFSAALGLLSLPASAGERVVCKLWLDDGGIAARSTAPSPAETPYSVAAVGLASTTLDGFACATNRLQPDGGILPWDGGTALLLTSADGTNGDGGVAGCPACDFRGATTLVMQCRDPVYYSEKWDGGVDRWNQRGVVSATANDELVDFDVNPDGYRIDFRPGGFSGNNHISVKPVTASATNFCTFATVSRKIP